ncbi:MAG: peptidoglycan editing factor PgeF [Chloroflexi bacterium]|nr:MAG: peptidoglycan editing factor PgeF [Chloroflexota bacterium]
MVQTSLQPVYPTTVQNLKIFQIDKFNDDPSLIHAIFTRNGGVSQGNFKSLNLSTSVGDNPDAVNENMAIACRAVGVLLEKTVSCRLVHGADIATVTRHNQRQMMGRFDGLITAEPDIYLFMRFADCTPLLFFDPVRRAVGLTHAGWRGTMQNAAGATVKAMVNRLGCRAKNITAVIGPAIGPCCYEVGPEVISAAQHVFTGASTLFTANGRPGHARFDMWQANRRQLADAGVQDIISAEICTACHTDYFFSHRAERGKTGRFGVILGMQ